MRATDDEQQRHRGGDEIDDGSEVGGVQLEGNRLARGAVKEDGLERMKRQRREMVRLVPRVIDHSEGRTSFAPSQSVQNASSGPLPADPPPNISFAMGKIIDVL